MSGVRMCDKCGTIFSENAEGWTTLTGTRLVTDSEGRKRQVTKQMDTCPSCSIGETEITPRLSLTASAGVERIAETMTQAERDRILRSTEYGKDEPPI